MRSAQQQSDRRAPPVNAVRTPNNNYNYMNGSLRGPQAAPSNGYKNSYNSCIFDFYNLFVK